VLVLGILLALLYGRIVRDMALVWWDDPNYSHGFLVPLFSVFVVWQDRAALAALESRGSLAGLGVLAAGLALLVLGVLGAENFLSGASFVVVLAGLVLFHLGGEWLRALAFPISFLLFMIPLPAILFNAIALPLQGMAAENATRVIETLGIPVLRDGNVIRLSHTTLGVTEACSGIRSLVSLLALAVVWASLFAPRAWQRFVLVASAVPITIVANAGRIVLTALLAEWLGVEWAQGFFHGFSGWIIFLVAFACLLGLDALLRRVSPAAPEPA
jgi:exosortase